MVIKINRSNDVDEKIFYELVGRRLRKRRLELSLTQEDVTSRLGIERTTLAHIEAARQKPSLWQCVLLCGELQLSLAEILPDELPTAAYNSPSSSQRLEMEIVGAERSLTPALSAVLREIQSSGAEVGGKENEKTSGD